MFANFKNSKSIMGSPTSSPKEKLLINKRDSFVTEQAFIKNFITLFIGDLD
jgi:Ca2+-binding EF-hand superfamily protein